MWHPMMNPTDAMPWMIVGQVAIWLAVIAGVVIIVREIARTIRARQETPLAIVQRRLANGEINHDEYDIVRRILEQADVRDTEPAATRRPSITA